MVAVATRRSRAGGVVKGCFNFVGDVFFFALMFLALLLLGINLKETFESLFTSVDLSKVTSLTNSLTKTISLGTGAQDPVVAPFEVGACSAEQLQAIQLQLPSEECLQNKESPYMYGGLCSFSYATRCPQPRWLHAYYKSLKAPGRRQAIHVGSSRGIDVVNTMRMLTFNSTYDKIHWKRNLFHDKPIDGESCESRIDPVFGIPAEVPVSQADVHVFEANPDVAKDMEQTIQAMGYGPGYHLVKGAVGATEGTVKVGETDVKQYTLDAYTKQNLDMTVPIDYLHLLLGSEDAPVLDGAKETLANTNYLEFEYTWKGSWAGHSLSQKIAFLKERGLVCYWAGTGGNLWRITDCWQGYYDVKVWSRIACVKRTHFGLLNSMEEYFNKTLEAGPRILYKDRNTAETNGRGI